MAVSSFINNHSSRYLSLEAEGNMIIHGARSDSNIKNSLTSLLGIGATGLKVASWVLSIGIFPLIAYVAQRMSEPKAADFSSLQDVVDFMRNVYVGDDPKGRSESLDLFLNFSTPFFEEVPIKNFDSKAKKS